MRVALIGTRGVPARYGGFETCVEEVGRRLASRGHEVTVYCRSGRDKNATGPAEALLGEYQGMRLVHLPALRRKVLETLSHTALSVAHVVRHGTDVAIVFNAANSPLLPALRARRVPVATHVDGLEWRRSKWSGAGQRYYRTAEALSVRWSDALIADAHGIQDYYRHEFGAESDYIAYGAPILLNAGKDRLTEFDVESERYHLVVARFEPENHVAEIVDGYRRSSAQHPLVVVGSAPYSDAYTAEIRRLAAGDQRIQLVGGVWDQTTLDQLYGNCLTYLHGHSVGGTNPSLLRAIGAGAATVAFDVGFNREVLGEAGRYFRRAEDVGAQVLAAEADPAATTALGRLLQEGAGRYDWDAVAGDYEALCLRLIQSGPTKSRPTGKRSNVDLTQGG